MPKAVTSLAMLAVAWALVSRASETPIVADVPICAQACFLDNVAKIGCASVLDLACQCDHQDMYWTLVRPCVQASCIDAEDQLATLRVATEICASQKGLSDDLVLAAGDNAVSLASTTFVDLATSTVLPSSTAGSSSLAAKANALSTPNLLAVSESPTPTADGHNATPSLSQQTPSAYINGLSRSTLAAYTMTTVAAKILASSQGSTLRQAPSSSMAVASTASAVVMARAAKAGPGATGAFGVAFVAAGALVAL